MDSRQFIRDPDKVRAACRSANDGSVIAVKPSKIYLPERFLEKQLASVGAVNYIAGLFAHVVEDRYYAVFRGVCMVRTEPTSIASVKFGEEAYLEFSFEPGARILVTQEVVQERILTYNFDDEVIAKGHVPWYCSYEDVMMLLFTADRLAGVGMLKNHALLELNAAAICRDPANVARYYRHTVSTYEDTVVRPPRSIPLMSVSYGTTDTVSRITGSYFEDGINSSLASPSDKVQNIERLLRT